MASRDLELLTELYRSKIIQELNMGPNADVGQPLSNTEEVIMPTFKRCLKCHPCSCGCEHGHNEKQECNCCGVKCTPLSEQDEVNEETEEDLYDVIDTGGKDLVKRIKEKLKKEPKQVVESILVEAIKILEKH